MLQSILLQNVYAITKSLLHSSVTATAQSSNRNDDINPMVEKTRRILLKRGLLKEDDEAKKTPIKHTSDHNNNSGVMTQKEFEDRKRELTILLDLSVQSKMKIEKAFPQKLAKFGKTKADFDKYGLNWHPGWREPQRFVPEVDCDPYRGACMISSCPCDSFESWPMDDVDYGATNDPDLIRTYVYNPRLINPETDLCYVCHHLKSDHTLWSPSMETSRSKLTEFNRANTERYSIQYAENVPLKHPMNVPQYILQRYYDEHPDVPGASVQAAKILLADIEEDNDSGKSMSMMAESDDLFDEDDIFS